MDVKPVYELRERLRSAMLAGINLLSEDFRLRRALEALKPLEAASPVFAKAGQLTAQLLSPDCPCPQFALLEAITLLDAVICTLAAVEVEGKVEAAGLASAAGHLGSVMVPAPCSLVKELIEALTTSGSGHYAYVENLYETKSWIFKDYRVKHAMVKALGASYTELAGLVQTMLFGEDESIVPLLKKDFNPKGKIEMMRRLQLIGSIAGAKENDFYREMLPDATKDIRLELLRLLRLDQSNIELLLHLAQTEKGKNKEMALESLGRMDDDRVIDIYENMAKKKLSMVCRYLLTSTTRSASKLIARLCMEQLSKALASIDELRRSDSEICANCSCDDEKNCPLNKSLKFEFCRCVEALIGKSGDEVIACYRELLANKDTLQVVSSEVYYDVITVGYKGWNDRKKRPWDQVIGMHLASSFVLKASPQTADFIMAQAEENVYFLTAASLVKLCHDEHCTAWFDEQLKDGVYANADVNKLTSIKAAIQYIRWDASRHAYVAAGHAQGSDEEVKQTLDILGHKEVLDWMMQIGWDELVYQWTNKDDAAECAKVGEWFYDRCLAIEGGAFTMLFHYLEYMQGCGWKKCQGIARVFALVRGRYIARELWQILDFFQKLPGDTAAVLAELDAFVKLAEEGTIKGMTAEVAEYSKRLRKELSWK